MTKKILTSILLNVIVFAMVLSIKDITILLFIGGIYIIPAVVNLLSMKLSQYESPFYCLPLITTITYSVFSYLFMQKQSFTAFILNYQKEMAGLSIQINENLLDFGPLLFVFLFNFSFIYLSYRLTGGNDYARR